MVAGAEGGFHFAGSKQRWVAHTYTVIYAASASYKPPCCAGNSALACGTHNMLCLARPPRWYDINTMERAAPLIKKRKRKPPSGTPTNALVFTACKGSNDHLFPQILSLYVAPGSKVADVTFGKGVFWRKVEQGQYQILGTDIQTGVDCTNLPYGNRSIDCVVFDPPYMHTPGGTAHVNHQNYEDYYRNNETENQSTKKYHEAVLDLYFRAAKEAYRILRKEGIYIVKCGDEVCSNQQRLTHVELINKFSKSGFVPEDLFVLVRFNRPGVSSGVCQAHARKNHSYFLVFRKSTGRKRWTGIPREGPQPAKAVAVGQSNRKQAP